jgi:hypothetical protein
VVALRRLRSAARYLVAVLFGLALALLIAEAAVRLLYPSLPIGLQTALRNVHVTPFSDARLAPPPLWQSDLDYLNIVRPGAVNSLQAGSPTVTFHVTSYNWWGGRVGFRSPPPDDGNVQAVAIGDSFTFCYTELEDCWVTRLRQDTGLPLLNMGQPVTGSVSHARLYYDFVAKPELKLKQPRLVLWQFFGNDYNDDYGLADLNHTAKTPPQATPNATPLPQGALVVWLRENSAMYGILSALIRRDPGVEQFVEPYSIWSNGVELHFGSSYIRDSFDMTQAHNQEGEQLSQQAILQTRDLVEKNGGRFVVLAFPTKEEVYWWMTEPVMGKKEIEAIAAPRLRLLDFCKAQNLTCLDLLPGLRIQAEQNKQLYYPNDSHLNAEGNRAVAALVSAFLRDQGLVAAH